MDEIKLAQAHRQLMLSSMKHYVKEMFRQQYNKEFVFNTHHQQICDALDKVVRGETKKLIINIAPRYSKTELCVKMFISYGLAVNPKSRFIHLSYSQNLATDNSVAAKDLVGNEYYEMIFGHRLRAGRNSKTKWDTNEGGGVYATSTLGQITGFGAGAVEEENVSDLENVMLDKYCANDNGKFSGAIIIDDPLKPEDALSDNSREAVNRRFESTIRNRVNSRNTPIVIIMQRLHDHDLCGYLMEKEPGEWTVLSLPCLTVDEEGNEKALWPFKHTLEELHHLREIDPYVFESQYQQNPSPLEGLMYSGFKTYSVLPVLDKSAKRKAYVDTADLGSDFLCCICYIETQEAIYVTDVLFTQAAMEVTEPATARMLTENNVDKAIIESNNGGRGFARNVETNLRKLGNLHTTIQTFTQTKNKKVRIFSHSAEVCNMIYFPTDWEKLWPKFARDIKNYPKEGNPAHDDAEDALTGVVENHCSKKKRGVEVL